MAQVYLVPGFFGFTALGSFNYFHRVSAVLGRALAEHGVHAEVIETDTLPAGSIRRRAIRLLDLVRQHGGLEQDHLHFVGHSTGGLDVRLLLTPGVKLQPTREEAELAARTRTVISLSTPHHGTHLANFFTNVNGRNLLYVLTLLATSAPGRYSMYAGSRLLTAVAHMDRFAGQKENILDSLARNVLSRIRPEQGDALWEFVREIGQDQGAMVQLTPEAMDLFNAAVLDRENVTYVSFASASPPPSLRSFMIRPRNLYQPFTHAIYAASHKLAGKVHRHYPYPTPEESVLQTLEGRLPFAVDTATNDGVVPLFSQIRGRFGGAFMGDHLDVVGQFHHEGEEGAYPTWLHSGSGFNEERFQRLWSDIAGVMAAPGA